MRDLIDPRLMYLKAWLFLLAGLGAAALLVMESPSLRTVVLIGVTVWAFSRLYYFLFYVIERYIDPKHRFAGVLSAARYVAGRRGGLTP
ncbi:MAG: hypothetical protein QM783_15225 [Phycisphaerales bacterium]